jgi:hypothetical protein
MFSDIHDDDYHFIREVREALNKPDDITEHDSAITALMAIQDALNVYDARNKY